MPLTGRWEPAASSDRSTIDIISFKVAPLAASRSIRFPVEGRALNLPCKCSLSARPANAVMRVGLSNGAPPPHFPAGIQARPLLPVSGAGNPKIQIVPGPGRMGRLLSIITVPMLASFPARAGDFRPASWLRCYNRKPWTFTSQGDQPLQDFGISADNITTRYRF